MGEFRRYLEGKRVVLVGPASTLQGKGLGPFIDAFDVVVRLNHAWPLPQELKDDIGSRTDVLYHNLNPDHQRFRRSDVIRMKEAGVKWFVSAHPTNRIAYRRRLRRFRRLNRGLLKTRAMPASVKRHLRRRVGSSNAGVAAIVDLLRFPLAHLHVTGFSFYTTGYLDYPSYAARFHTKALLHHDQNRHKTYLARLVAREARLSVDPVIARLLTAHMKQAGPRSLSTGL